MLFEEAKSEGLNKEYIVTINKEDVNKEYKKQLEEVRSKMNLPGFRPGKVKEEVAKKQYNSLIIEKTLEQLIQANTRKILDEKKPNYVDQPKVEITSYPDNEDLSKKDLTYKILLEIFPEITVPDFASIELEKRVANISDTDIEKTIKDIAENNKEYEASTAEAASSGDAVLIDYVGRIDGVEFNGGKGENHKLILGSASFIPGFEDQLIGSKKGEEKLVKVTFPTEYHSAEFAGKNAEFTVKINDILSPKDIAIDDELAKKFGLENLEKLREAVREKLTRDTNEVSRIHLKKQLFDILEKKCDFLAPSSLTEKEFNALWEDFTKSKNKEFDGKNEEEQKQEFHSIAKRRVMLGLLISEVAKIESLKVTQADMREAINTQAKQFPGQEHIVLDYYRKNPKAIEALTGPMLEDKVVDNIISKIKCNDTTYNLEEFLKLNNDDA